MIDFNKGFRFRVKGFVVVVLSFVSVVVKVGGLGVDFIFCAVEVGVESVMTGRFVVDLIVCVVEMGAVGDCIELILNVSCVVDDVIFWVVFLEDVL